ncbi:MAG: (2Fe-2S)-binding protein [bacterium]|nr:(2Fe-2S)-binding protein [bacterium]
MSAPGRFTISIRVNGEPRRLNIAANALLLDVLRDNLGLKAAREGCGTGACGTCTVLLDGNPISACLKLAATLPEGCAITTVEGLAEGERLDPVQEAFLAAGAFQCAFCTSGMMLTVKALLAANPRPTDDEARAYLNGNYCRCGAYPEILAAVRKLAENARP